MFDRFKEVIANLKNLLKAKKRVNISHYDPQTANLRVPYSQELYHKMDDSWNAGWKRTS
ncbi:MAG: hypothetical protein ACTSR7_15145 [Promethearchaeota archaeon]